MCTSDMLTGQFYRKYKIVDTCYCCLHASVYLSPHRKEAYGQDYINKFAMKGFAPDEAKA